MMQWEKNLNALMAIILALILFQALFIQFFKHETPCPLCLLQRLGMLGVASGALMNVKFGPRHAHYGMSLLSSVFGGFVALRQVALHVCPGFVTFGHPFWGLSLYTWSFIIFASSVTYIALLLLIFDRKETDDSKSINSLGYFAFAFLFLAAFINIFSTLWQCGLSACVDV